MGGEWPSRILAGSNVSQRTRLIFPMPDQPPDPSQRTPEEILASPTPLFAANEKITRINVADEIKGSFLDYSMSVIISRALPDARDGLKPSQRRILYAMHELGVLPNRKHVKCAKIVGETMGNYHPHGDMAIYPTLVHMAQPWAMREMLIEGQGNFGSVDGDPPASMRYTEAKLRPMGAVLMEDMDKETVDFVPNYDETRTEPVVFPAAFPNLIVNGGTGIAVGMATNMAPHNLGEVITGVCAQIDNPAITTAELMRLIKGPDFPTGCIICGVDPIKEYFTTGKGSLKVRGKIGLEEAKGGRENLIVTEIPYGVNRSVLVKRIAELVNEKIVTDISGVRDESDENTRLVIELKRDAIPKVVINNLYKSTQLETTFAVNSLAIDHGRPKTLGMKALIACYIEHRREVVIRRTKFELKKAEERAETLEGYLIALANMDEFIRIIRNSRTREEAKIKLLAFEFTRVVVEGFWSGIHRSPYHGFSVEFTEYRQYSPGDDARYLDWKLFARSDRFFIKKFEDETNLRCHLLVDNSRSMTYGSMGYTKAQYANTLAATLAYFLYLQGDAVGLLTFDEQIREYLPARHRTGHLRHLMLALEKPAGGSATDLAKPLQRIVQIVRKRGLMVLISDFLAPIETLERNLVTLGAWGHDVLLFHLLDPAEAAFDFIRAAMFQDLESGRDLFIDPAAARRSYLAQQEAHGARVQGICQKLGMSYCRLATDRPLELALFDFLRERRQRGRFVRRAGSTANRPAA